MDQKQLLKDDSGKLPQNDFIVTLQQENETLKQQLDKALELPRELEVQHKKTRELTSQLLDANQKIENLQNRLKMSQQRTQESENKQMESETKIRQMTIELEKSINSKHDLEQKMEELKTQQEKFSNSYESANNEQQLFFGQMAALCSQEITSYSQCLDAVKSIQNISRKQSEAHNEMKEVQKKVQKQSKKIQKLKEAVAQLAQEKEQMVKERDECQKGISNVASETKQKVAQANGKISELKSKIAELRGELKKKDDAIEREKENTQKVMSEKQSEKQMYEQLIGERNQRIAELKERAQVPEIQANEERERLIDDIAHKCQENELLNDRLRQSQNLIKELENKVRASYSQIQKVQNSKDKLKQKQQQYETRVAELEKTIAVMKLEQDSNYAQQNNNNMELESLRMQLQAAEVSHTQGAAAFEAQRQETEKLKKSLDLIEQTVKDLRNEIDSLNTEKTKLLDIVKKQNLLINELEKTAKDSKQAADDLRKKLKLQTDKMNDPYENPQLVSTIQQNFIPLFNEPLRSKLTSLLASTPGHPLQKANSVFRAVADAYIASGQPAKEKEEELKKAVAEFNSKKDAIDSILSLAEATIQSLSFIARTLKSDNEAMQCEPGRNKEMLDCATKSLQKLEGALSSNDLLDPQFVSMTFLTGGSFEDRRAALQEVATLGWNSRITFDLFCLQLLINSVQEKELQQMRASYDSIYADIEQIKDATGCEDISLFSEYISQLASKMLHMKSVNKKLNAYIKSLESREDEIKAQEDLVSAYEELQQQVCEMEQQIKHLQSEIKKSQTLLRQREMKIQQLEETNARNETVSTEEMQRLRAEITDYEHEIDEKNIQIRNLNLQLQQSKSETEIQLRSAKKQADEVNASNIAKIEKYQLMYQQVKEKKKASEKALIQKYNDAQKTQQNEMTKLVQCQNELKEKLADTIQQLRQQSDEKNALAKKLTENLNVSEERNKQMTAEITKLSMAKKSLEVQVQSLTDQLKREVQLISSQNAFKEISIETRHQEEIASLKSKFNAEKNNLLLRILEEFDAIDILTDTDIDEESALDALHKVSDDYRKKKCVY